MILDSVLDFVVVLLFYHSVSINHILDLHDLYDWNVRCIVDEIIDNIEREFLNETIRQKEN